jgi:hypothetical protein
MAKPPPLPVPVPKPVQAILDRTLAKDPEDRYPTPAELLTALLAARATPIDPELPPSPPRRRARDILLRTAAGGIAVPAMLVSAAFLWSLIQGQENGGKVTATSPTAIATPRADPAGGMTVTPSPTTTQQPPTEPARRLVLEQGERKELELLSEGKAQCLDRQNTPREVKVLLTIVAIQHHAATPGRVTISYRLSVPKTAGLECRPLAYARDETARIMSLVSFDRQGREIGVPLSTSEGLGLTGAEDVYGQSFIGGWVFDNVELAATELALAWRNKLPDGALSDIIQIPRLRRE